MRVREKAKVAYEGMQEWRKNMFSGLLIKESLADETILDFVKIKDVAIWTTENTPKYWTAISFDSTYDDFPERLSHALSDNYGTCWYVDFQKDNVKYVVLKDHVLRYNIGNDTEKKAVMNKCRELGVPQEQLDWSE